MIFEDIMFYAIIALAIGIVAGFSIHKFITMPNNEKITKIKSWLLYATAMAEAEMGAGTGQLKLAKVYSMFLEKFPKLSQLISYERFCKLVDEVLVTLRKLIESNAHIDEFISLGEKTV